MLISSVDNKTIKEIRKLKEKKYIDEQGLFIIEGDHLIKEAIRNNKLVSLYLLEGYECDYNFKYDTLTIKVMKTLSDLKSTPRVIGIAKKDKNELLGNKILLLDDIQDPGNAGTIIRNAVAFGIDTIVFSKYSVSPYNIKTIRSAQGMIFNVNIITDDLEKIINRLKEQNFLIFGTSLKNALDSRKIEKTNKYAVVFGNEGSGVKDEILNKCDKVYKINMESACESLNVGVSCGIILNKLYEENL